MNTRLKGINISKIIVLNALLENGLKEEFFNTIGQYIYDDGLNHIYMNLLNQAYNKWHKEAKNDII